MAKKQTKESNESLSQPQGFTGGMITDADPRYQIKGSYRDALNIRLSNDDQSTFTVENILGNKKIFNLNDICTQTHNGFLPEGILGTRVASKAGVTASGDKFSEIYMDPSTTDTNGNPVGDYFPSDNNNAPTPLSATFEGIIPFIGTSVAGGSTPYPDEYDASIVGHYSYNRNVIFIIVIPHYAYLTTKTQTIFLNVQFNKDLNIEHITDLMVSYDHLNQNKYPDLNMDLDMPVRVEGIVENECISRIFWTDNKNPLRSLNIQQPSKNRMSPDVLDLTPMHSPSQPVVTKTLAGSLPVGQLQYCFKYLSSNGGESVMSPFSNLYHTSKHSFATSTQYYGSVSGDPFVDVSSQGFEVTITDLDNDFDIVELYAILHVSNDGPIRVSRVGGKQFGAGASEVNFYHTQWGGDLITGVDEVLIDINTWDVCKDISIKDNILFAGNLKTRDNSISEKEWNVKVRRYNIADESGSSNTGTITSDDSQIKEYEIDGNGDTTTVTPSLGTTWTNGTPKWRTYKGDDVTTINAVDYEDKGRVDIVKKQSHEYRYLTDGMTLGGESYDYAGNSLGGCRLTFGLKEKSIDIQNNISASPYIQASSISDMSTDNISDDGGGGNKTDNSDTIYTATMGIGGSKDPATGNFKGYRRGEMYRFGVHIYDKNGRPGNVLWIGDIEMPEMNDPVRMLRTGDNDYDPTRPTNDGTNHSLHGKKLFSQHENSGDHRTSFVYGISTPSIDVAWFNQTVGAFTNRHTLRYILDGEFKHETNTTLGAPTETSITASTSSDTGTNAFSNGLNLLAAYVYPGTGAWDLTAGALQGWYSAKSLENWGGFMQSDFTVKQLPAQYKTWGNQSDEVHYSLDLFVNFEFRIPSNVRDKISGFRVVRAERTEADKSILQQGILNQTVAYGHNEVPKGYNQTNYINEEDTEETDLISNIGDSHSTSVIIHNPFDSYLNGYIGLAENSNLGFYDSTSSNNYKLLPNSAEHDDNFYCFKEREEAAGKASNGTWVGYDNQITYDTFHMPFGNRPKKRHSSYFGCYEVMPNTLDSWSGAHKTKMDTANANHTLEGACAQAVQGSLFTLDSPDSIFGVSGYSFRTGDKIRVDAVMKLIYDYKTELRANSAGPTASERPFGIANHSGNNKGAPGTSLPSGDLHRVSTSTGTDWSTSSKHDTIKDSLRYARKINAGSSEEGYGALIAKYYIYDTYWGIGMSVDGGAGYAKGHNPTNGIEFYNTTLPDGTTQSVTNSQYRPSQHHDIYHHNILQAKELFPGEIVGKSFFKDGVLMIDKGESAFANSSALGEATNVMNGFSNNTLGFYAGGRQKRTDGGGTWYSGGTSFLFSAMRKVTDNNSGTKHDRTYDTISTVQEGQRTILIQIDGDGVDGEKRGLLNPRDLSNILEHRNWGAGGVNTYHAWQSHVSNEKIKRGGGIDADDANYGEAPGGDFGGPSYIPYKFLCSIVRNNIPYGGPGLNAIMKTRYIPAGNFHPVKKDVNGDSEEGHLSQVFGGDTFVTFFTHQKTTCPYEQRSLARWQVFPVESDANTDMRMGFHLGAGDIDIGEVKPEGDVQVGNVPEYNDVYSQENNLKSAISIDETKTCKSLELPYQIVYSETKISGEPTDSFKTFLINSFHDMESEYGEVTRLKKWKNDLYVLQEESLAKLLVNPISMIQDELGTSLNVGTGETVENHLYISTKFGTRNMDSVVTSEQALYYIDNTYAKLLQYTGDSLNILSDNLGQRNSLNNIIKGVGDLDSRKKVDRNFICDNSLKFNGITSIFDYKNNELIITMHSSVLDDNNTRVITSEDSIFTAETNSKTLVYSESINAFTSYYSVTPRKWMDIGGYVTSTESMSHLGDATHDFNENYLSLWKWDDQIYDYKTVFFDEDSSTPEISESSITKTMSELPSISKVFDNAQIIMTPNAKTNLTNQELTFNTEISNGVEVLNVSNNVVKYQEGILRFPLRDPSSSEPRQRGTYINIKYSTRSTNKFNIFAILAKYRKSYQ